MLLGESLCFTRQITETLDISLVRGTTPHVIQFTISDSTSGQRWDVRVND
jgi:hypothetical protein